MDKGLRTVLVLKFSVTTIATASPMGLTSFAQPPRHLSPEREGNVNQFYCPVKMPSMHEDEHPHLHVHHLHLSASETQLGKRPYPLPLDVSPPEVYKVAEYFKEHLESIGWLCYHDLTAPNAMTNGTDDCDDDNEVYNDAAAMAQCSTMQQ
ncbi:hypothetical protein EI94DRAFT_1705470 [Lactarius quietus]|nr:hypothetical protein EI94DRAFT_1705470 [Lactarius quietus]